MLRRRVYRKPYPNSLVYAGIYVGDTLTPADDNGTDVADVELDELLGFDDHVPPRLGYYVGIHVSEVTTWVVGGGGAD